MYSTVNGVLENKRQFNEIKSTKRLQARALVPSSREQGNQKGPKTTEKTRLRKRKFPKTLSGATSANGAATSTPARLKCRCICGCFASLSESQKRGKRRRREEEEEGEERRRTNEEEEEKEEEETKGTS